MRSEVNAANELLAELEWLSATVDAIAAGSEPAVPLGAVLPVLLTGLDDPAAVPNLTAALNGIDLDGLLVALAQPTTRVDLGAQIRTLDEAARQVRRWLTAATTECSVEDIAALEVARTSREATFADFLNRAVTPPSPSGPPIVFVLLLRDADDAGVLVDKLENALISQAECIGYELLLTTRELRIEFDGSDPQAIAAAAIPLLVPYIADRGSYYEWTDHNAPDGKAPTTRTDIQGPGS
jgi:hypothetical protein